MRLLYSEIQFGQERQDKYLSLPLYLPIYRIISCFPGNLQNWPMSFIFLLLLLYFLNLFLAVLGLLCCARAFSSCGEQGLLFFVAHGLLIAVASLVAEHRL